MNIDLHQFHGLLHSASLVEAELRRHIAPLGIHPRQAQILDAMDRLGPVSQADLAAGFGVTPASMSTMTDRLLGAGYITRTPNPVSRRENVLELTEKGRTLLEGIAKAWTAVDATISTVLGKNADAFITQAQLLRDGLGGAVPGAARATIKLDQ
ncbi:MarR family transcriptional regulator [Celeribacter halophilus]|jgi:DNA-binding MarR family transcriptional regulator|uniref:MarR family transcriptional regulator n=1 Tax=Celeribacter halophilus TaxID=576117 RepID=A0AAW7XQM3_9RHOB|nr:MarR family transcriptional regulator [Celeribacter halophilus]MDO6456305.1 MarR family transcriptional regulator [Celeribacter halophilus]